MAIRMTEECFERKYFLYSQEIFNIAYGYTRNVLDSEDIVQNVFIKLLQNTKDFSTELEEKYWLIRVCINECINFVKSSHKKRVVYNDEIVYSTPNGQINNNKNNDLLNEIVSNLPEKYKLPIVLFYYDNLKVNDISKLMGISEVAVRKRLERARGIIKEKMEAYHG